jgi:hypothetical protein
MEQITGLDYLGCMENLGHVGHIILSVCFAGFQPFASLARKPLARSS